MSESIFSDADTPTELLGLFAGAASVCWTNIGGAGVFDSTRASELVDMALERLIELGWAPPPGERDAALRALDDIEKRIRHQAEVAPVASMEWRAHMADIAHINQARMDIGTLGLHEEKRES